MGVSDEREARAPEGISKPPSEGISEKVSDVILGIASDGTAASALGGIDKALGAAGRCFGLRRRPFGRFAF